MFKLFITAALIMLAVSCSTLSEGKDAMAAVTVDDVIYAWNEESSNYNFDGYIPDETLGGAYYGAAYQLDRDGLLLAIQNHARVLSMRTPQPGIGDSLSEVVNSPEWYE